MSKYVFLLTIILSQSLWATTFLETSLEDRLRSAQGVIKGSYLGSSSKRLPTGQIVTEASFRILSVSGIRPNEIVNQHNFKILYPGGSWLGKTYRIHGAPSFTMGEVSYLIVTKGKFGYRLANLSMSKYSPIKRGGEEYLQSSVFPNKEGVGLISLSLFNQLVGHTFGSGLTAFQVDKFIDKGASSENIKRKSSRRPASVENSSENNTDTSFSMIWLVVGLGGLGFFSSFLNRGKKDEKKNF